jgi:hypothetical protein
MHRNMTVNELFLDVLLPIAFGFLVLVFSKPLADL